MSSSCCGGSAKSELKNIATTAATPAVEATSQQPVANTEKSGCCSDKSEKGEKHGCGC